jgi:hypothetical protein
MTMRALTVLLLVVLSPAASAAQAPADITLRDLLDRVKRAEGSVIANMRGWNPVMEVYIQSFKAEQRATIADTYFLGRFTWDRGPRLQMLGGGKDAAQRRAKSMKLSGIEFIPDGFAFVGAPDWEPLDEARYDFSLVRREFLGELRTYVFDVRPKQGERAGFTGRIWVEDAGFSIVRFNGINRRINSGLFRRKLPVHVDSWRVNVQPNVWLPAYAYVEESGLQGVGPAEGAHFKGQVRFWGYDPGTASGQQSFTAIDILEPGVRDAAGQPKQLSPIASQRAWEREAEVNVIDRLEKASLLAPAGEVERILETVINNVVVTNDLQLDVPVTARVLLTAPLESFTVGHTIVLSRGLIDVLPDEASLAMMLARELGHIVLGHPLVDTRFAFADRMMVSDDDLLQVLALQRNQEQETAADTRAVEMLLKSPYKDKLTGAGLFLRAVAERTERLPNLIQAHLGNHPTATGPQPRLGAIAQLATAAQPDQMPALSLGARLVLDPWSNRLELSRAATPALVSPREQMPFTITPLIPYLSYVKVPPPAVAQN